VAEGQTQGNRAMHTPFGGGSQNTTEVLAAGVEGIVLAGVHAWGDCPLERELCRPLFPVAGYPVIGHALHWLADAGIQKAKVCANSDTAAIRGWLGGGDAVGLALKYVEDRMPRGPAGCARDAATESVAELFVIVEGTVLPQLDMDRLLAAHRGSGAALTVAAVVEGDAPRRGGETRPERLEPAGVYVVSRAALEHVPATGYQDIKESLIPRLHAAGQLVMTYIVGASATPRVADAVSYLAVSKWAVERLVAEEPAPAGYVRLGEALIHESARLHARARFIGPVLIGPHCRIEEDAMVVGPATVGEGCVIGRQAVVCRCVLWTGCQVREGAVLDHCILSDGAAVEPNQTLRESVCVAEQPRRGWRERISSLLGRRQARALPSHTPRAGWLPPAASQPLSPRVVIKVDHEETDGLRGEAVIAGEER